MGVPHVSGWMLYWKKLGPVVNWSIVDKEDYLLAIENAAPSAAPKLRQCSRKPSPTKSTTARSTHEGDRR